MSPRPTADAVRDLVRPLRSLNALAWIGLSLGLAALILGTLAWIARVGWFSAPWWVLLAWALVLVAALGLFISGRRFSARLSSSACAMRLKPWLIAANSAARYAGSRT